MKKYKVAITGASGMVGTRVIELLSDQFEFIPVYQADVDITDRESLMQKFGGVSFDFLIHLAAYTNVDKAEVEKEICHKINVDGTRNLFELCEDKKAKMIYISTDFVFDGKRVETKTESLVGTLITSWQTPTYDEKSVPNPISVYGQTKYEGEQVVRGNAMIIRFSYPYRAQFDVKKDFVRTIASLLKAERRLSFVDDSLIVPTFIDDIAHALGHLISNYSPEIFHPVGADAMSPYGAAVDICHAFDLPIGLIEKTTYEEYFKGKAQRPQYSHIISTKKFGVNMHSFASGLQELKNQGLSF